MSKDIADNHGIIGSVFKRQGGSVSKFERSLFPNGITFFGQVLFGFGQSCAFDVDAHTIKPFSGQNKADNTLTAADIENITPGGMRANPVNALAGANSLGIIGIAV